MKLVLLLAVLAIGCTSANTPQLEPTCVGACQVLGPKTEANPYGLGCPEGEPSPLRGVPCVDWCSNYHNLGYLKPWASCVSAAAGDVGAVRACGVRCQR